MHHRLMSLLPLPEEPVLPKTPRERQAELLGIFHTLLFLLLGPVLLVVKVHLQNGRLPTYIRVLLLLLGSVWIYLGIYLNLSVRKDTELWEILLAAWTYFWVLSILAIEWWAIVVAGGEAMIRAWINRETHAEKQRRLLEEEYNKYQVRVVELSRGVPDTPANFLPLGVCLGSVNPESPSKYFTLTRNNHLGLHEKAIPEHFLVIGTTGAGKTSLLQHCIEISLKYTPCDIFTVDGKGDELFAANVATLMHTAIPSRGPVPVFSLEPGTNTSLYHAFKGTGHAIYNRLSAMLHLEDMIGDSRYHADQTRRLLVLICGTTNPFVGVEPPRSFEELYDRVSKKTLTEIYRDHDKFKFRANDVENEVYKSLRARLEAFESLLGTVVGPDGFALEETRGAIFSLPSMSYGETSRSFARLLTEDLKDFINQRRTRPAFIVIDEFGEIGAKNVLTLLRMARGKDVGIILASQTVTSLGDLSTQQQITELCRTKILMASDYPEILAQTAGTTVEPRISSQYADGEATGRNTVNLQTVFKIDMDQARALNAGEAFVIRQGHVYKIRIPEPKLIVPHPDSIRIYAQKPVYSKPSPKPKQKQKQEPENLGIGGVR